MNRVDIRIMVRVQKTWSEDYLHGNEEIGVDFPARKSTLFDIFEHCRVVKCLHIIHSW